MANAGTLTNDEIRHRIVRIFAQFVSDVDPDRLSDFLKQENVLGIGEYQEISARNPAPQNRCRSLLDHLLRKAHPRTFLIVREALRHDGHYLLNYIDEMHIMADHSPFNDDSLSFSRGSTTVEESFEADGRRLQCEDENQLQQQLLMRNGELEGKLLQMERQTMADKAKILELVEKLETHEATWSVERDYLLKRQRELEHRHNSDIVIIRGLEHKLERQRKQWDDEKEELRSHFIRLPTGQLTPTDDIDCNINATLIRTIRTRAADDENKGIAGLTVLSGELFIVSRMSSEIEVYDSTSFNLKRRMLLAELRNPEDIGSCGHNNCIYISDWKYFDQTKEILRINPDGKLLKLWSTDDNGGCLSVSEDSNVILTVGSRNRLHEYTCDGLPLRVVYLTPDIVHPSHALKLTSGQFVVSYGDVGDREHGVCILDESGHHIVRSVVGTKSSVFDGLDAPSYIAVDYSKGSILVLDRNNKRVLLFSPTLCFKGELLSRDEGLQDSHRMFIDSSGGRLFVADNIMGWRDGRVLVLEIRL